jgi:hypothetical protein
MNKYSDLTVTELRLDIELELVGHPEFRITAEPALTQDKQTINQNIIKQTYYLDLLTPFSVTIELYNKHYNIDNQSAIIINRLSVDNIQLIPKYDYLAEYINDHDNNSPTSYLGFNGKWQLTIDRPFYQWLHQVTAQGWLLE